MSLNLFTLYAFLNTWNSYVLVLFLLLSQFVEHCHAQGFICGDELFLILDEILHLALCILDDVFELNEI